MSTRRELLAVFGAGAFAACSASFAQSGKVWRIGFLHVGDDHMPPSYDPMRVAMGELGYEDGRNVRYDFSNVADDRAALKAAQAFARDRVDLIVAFDQEACSAAHVATKTIPIVMIHASNGIAAGFAKTLARPGGNMTGFAGRAELPVKELEILHEIAPRLSRALLVFDSHDAASVGWRGDVRRAANALGVPLLERDARDPASIDAVFAGLKAGDAEAVLFASTSVRHRHQKQVLPLATARGMAMVASRKDLVVDGGALFSYSYDFSKVGRAAVSRYIHPVLRGTHPGDLPIEEVTEYELVVNRGVASRHGWNLSQVVLVQAERIVE